MDGIRYFLALVFFCFGVYFLFDLIAFGFSAMVLLGSVTCFFLAHYVKPNVRKNDSEGFDLYDLVDLITDFPYRLVANILRGIGRILGGSKDGGGFEIDD